MSLKKNYIYNLTLTLSQFIFPIVTFPYVSRVLGVSAIGLTTYVESFSRYFLIFAVLGVPIYGMRQIAQNKNNKILSNKIFVEIFSLQFFTTVFCTLIYSCSLLFLKDFDLYWKLYTMGGFLILSNIFSLEWVFQGFEDFKYITIRTLILRLLTIILLFFFVRDEEDFNMYFFLLIFSSAANGLINYYYAKRYLSFTITFSLKRLKEHIKPVFITGSYLVAITIYSLLTILILGAISNSDSVGYYTVATKFNRIAIGFFSALSTVLIPRLSFFVASGNISDYHKTIEKSINFIFAFGFPISVSIFLMAPELVSIFAGPGYGKSIICLQIMSPLILIIGLAQVFTQQILIPFSKDKQNLITVLIGALLSVFMNLILINLYSEKGASLVTLVIEIVVTLISFYFANKIVKINIPLASLLKNLIFTIPYFAFSFFFRSYFNSDYQIILGYATVSLMYFLMLQYRTDERIKLFIDSKLKGNRK